MLAKAAQQFDELCEIKDIEERVRVACSKFSEGLISAKALRLLYDKLDVKNRRALLDGIYDENNPNALENMRRCPPNMFFPEGLPKRSSKDFFASIIAYEIIYRYKICKIPEDNQRFRKVHLDVCKVISEKYRKNIDIYEILNEARKIALKKIVKGKKHTTSKLNLPTNMTIGVELEFVGEDRRKVGALLEDLGMDVEDKLLGFGSPEKSSLAWKIKSDGSIRKKKKVKKNGKWTTKFENVSKYMGIEIVSPILEDSEDCWKQLEVICDAIKFLGGRCNGTCGGHIHIGADVLGVDTNAWKNFLTIWREVEPLIYMISNRRGESGRKGITRYASSVEHEIDSTLCTRGISIRTDSDLQAFAGSVSRANRYKGLNLINLSPGWQTRTPKKTIEFRVPNGIIDYDIIRENILLFGKMLKIAKLRSIDPTIKQKEFESFMEQGLEEREKMERFLELVFDTDEEKQIFFKRWLYNAGDKEKISVLRRKYNKQDKHNSRDMKEQIREVSETVDATLQVEAMETMIDDLGQGIETDRDDD